MLRHRVGQVWLPRENLLRAVGRDFSCLCRLSHPVPIGEFTQVDSQTENATKLNYIRMLHFPSCH